MISITACASGREFSMSWGRNVYGHRLERSISFPARNDSVEEVTISFPNVSD